MTELANKLERFECRRCNECCRQPGFVYLSEKEAEEAAEFLGVSAFDFVNEYCELQERQKLVLKKNGDESCVFLKDNGCAIHPVKPKQCVDFPLRWRTPRSFEYCEGMKELFK